MERTGIPRPVTLPGPNSIPFYMYENETIEEAKQRCERKTMELYNYWMEEQLAHFKKLEKLEVNEVNEEKYENSKVGECLIDALNIVNGDRNEAYGDPAALFEHIALLWGAYLRKDITPFEVAGCMVLLKMVRESFRHKDDNLIDMAGYVGIMDYIAKNRVE